MKKKPKKSAHAGRKRKPALGDRLNRYQIALRSGVDPKSVSKYLAMPGAPKPDRKMRFDYKEAVEHFRRVSPRLGGSSGEMQEIKKTILKMDAEERAIDLAVKKGELVSKKSIRPTIQAFMSALTADLQAKFERELPQKYAGRTTTENQAINAAAIDWVVTRIKAGAVPIAGPNL